MEIKTGDPILLVNAKGLKKYGLHKDMEGFCNSRVVLPDEGDYIMFQPVNTTKFFWIDAERFEVDEAKLAIMQGDETSDA